MQLLNYSVDFSKIHEMRKQNKGLSCASLSSDEDLPLGHGGRARGLAKDLILMLWRSPWRQRRGGR
jgi:hypothetical protein